MQTQAYPSPSLESKLGESRFNGGFERSMLIPQAKIFVGGLSHDTTDSSLRRFFEQFGEVLNAEVLRDHQTLNSRGFGFVTFLRESVASEVVRLGKVRPHTVDNKQVDVKVAVPKNKDLKEPSEHYGKRTPWQKQQDGITILHKEAGNRNAMGRGQQRLRQQRTASMSTTSSINSTDPFSNGVQTNKPAHGYLQRAHSLNVSSIAEHEPFGDVGYGFSVEKNSANAFNQRFSDSFQSQTTGKERSPTSTSSYSSTSLYSCGVPQLQRVSSMPTIGNKPDLGGPKHLVPNKVFVGGLLYATGHESLRKYFECFGDVESAEVIYNRDTKKSRGFGFVVFRSFDSVQLILQKQQIQRLTIDGKQIEVKLCRAREDSVTMPDCNQPERFQNNSVNAFSASSGSNAWDVDGGFLESFDNLPARDNFDNADFLGLSGQATSPISKLNRSSVPYIPQNGGSRMSRWASSSASSRHKERYDNFNFKYNINSLLPRISELGLH